MEMTLVYSLGPSGSVDRPSVGSLSAAEKTRVAPSGSECEENGSSGPLDAPEDACGPGTWAGVFAGRETSVGEICSFGVKNPLWFVSNLSPDGAADGYVLEVFFGTSELSNRSVNEPDSDAAEAVRLVPDEDVTWAEDSRLGGPNIRVKSPVSFFSLATAGEGVGVSAGRRPSNGPRKKSVKSPVLIVPVLSGGLPGEGLGGGAVPDREGSNPLDPSESLGVKTNFRRIALGVSAVVSPSFPSPLSFAESLPVGPLSSGSSSRGGVLGLRRRISSAFSIPEKNSRVKSPGGLGCTTAVSSKPMLRNSAEIVPASACAALAAAIGGSSSDRNVSKALVISSGRAEPKTAVGRSSAGRASATSVTLSWERR